METQLERSTAFIEFNQVVPPVLPSVYLVCIQASSTTMHTSPGSRSRSPTRRRTESFQVAPRGDTRSWSEVKICIQYSNMLHHKCCFLVTKHTEAIQQSHSEDLRPAAGGRHWVGVAVLCRQSWRSYTTAAN